MDTKENKKGFLGCSRCQNFFQSDTSIFQGEQLFTGSLQMYQNILFPLSYLISLMFHFLKSLKQFFLEYMTLSKSLVTETAFCCYWGSQDNYWRHFWSSHFQNFMKHCSMSMAWHCWYERYDSASGLFLGIGLGLGRDPHPYDPATTFYNFLSAFWCWLWRSTITIADGTHCSSVFRRFEVQVYCLPYPDFYKIHLLQSGRFSNLITCIQLVMSMFVTTFSGKLMFSKMLHANSMLHSQLSNHLMSNALLLPSTSFYSDVTSLIIANNVINTLWLMLGDFAVFSGLLKSPWTLLTKAP